MYSIRGWLEPDLLINPRYTGRIFPMWPVFAELCQVARQDTVFLDHATFPLIAHRNPWRPRYCHCLRKIEKRRPKGFDERFHKSVRRVLVLQHDPIPLVLGVAGDDPVISVHGKVTAPE